MPEKSGARAKSKLAVFPFPGDDVYEPVRAAVVRSLRRKGLNVTIHLRPVDNPQQFREMSSAANVAAYLEGEVIGEGPRQHARIRLRSGATGQLVTGTTFRGSTDRIVADVNRTLWARIGASVARSQATASAARFRRRERSPLRIDAGTPIDEPPVAAGSAGL